MPIVRNGFTLEKLLKLVDRYFSKVNAGELIRKELGINHHQLEYALRKAKMETSLHELICRKRCELARQYIQDNMVPVNDMHWYVGFRTPSAFRMSFLTHSGMTPLEYKRGLEQPSIRPMLQEEHPTLTLPRQQYVCDHVRKHFREPTLNIHEVSKRFNITIQEIEQIMFYHYHVDFKTRLFLLRMDTAAKEIQRTRNDVRVIAMGVGFRDYSFFVRKFEQKFGMGPKRYRTWCKIKSEVE